MELIIMAGAAEAAASSRRVFEVDETAGLAQLEAAWAGGGLPPPARREGIGEAAVRSREDNPADLDRARVEVAEWREVNPDGTREQLVADLGPRFRAGYGVVLYGVLFAVDRDRARQVPGGRP